MAGCWSSFLDFFRGDPSRKQFKRANAFYSQYKASDKKDLKALNNSIANYELALNNRRKTKDGLPHPDLGITLITYASVLWERYTITHSQSDVLKVIELDEEAYALWESDPASRPPDYPVLLLDLGNAYCNQYKVNPALHDMLGKAIIMFDKLKEVGTETDKQTGLIKLGDALYTWCYDDLAQSQDEKEEKLDRSIAILEKAIEGGRIGRKEGASDSSIPYETARQGLLTLAMAYNLRFQNRKLRADLDEAIKYNKLVLKHMRNDDTNTPYSLFDLAEKLFVKYEYEQGRRATGRSTDGAWLSIDLKADKGVNELRGAEGALTQVLQWREIDDAKHAELKSESTKLLDTVRTHITNLSRTASRASSSTNLNASDNGAEHV
ncbi:hypothetical protein JR316_0009214 [Psilocybe cubensis]|uniref:Uncharacterized protein n=2 Tax=Psilocybe cubensis TaxID=181762 RepID=A0A8H8CK30_PSICU|nr:hypothetical protein JR316_0009214 [Psilocybe cubensis]KAH9478754.1 hypothetical protein JR316_0009214 [Psilocybe cubensis]